MAGADRMTTEEVVRRMLADEGADLSSRNEEWLVGRAYLPAESISLVLADRNDHTDKEIKEEVAQLQAA